MAAQVILKALQYQGTTVSVLTGSDFIQGKPDSPVDIAIQFLVWIMLGHRAAKTIADIGLVFPWMNPAIDTDQCFGLKLPGGFFLGFTNGRLNQAFVGFEMAGGLV